MEFEQKSFMAALDYIKQDRDENRFVARVFLINNLGTYFSFINKLKEAADITVRLSDETYCKGSDTVPDLKALISFLDEHKDKDVLIPNLGEYLRIGEVTERNAGCLYSIINRHVHSKKRVWIPLFLAKGLFQSIVGSLDEERFSHTLIEIDETPVDFTATVYSKVFAKLTGIVNANGIREWLSLWDDQKIKTGMSFATRQIKQMTPTNGDYSLRIVSDPFGYIISELVDNVKLDKSLGTDEQWAALIPFVSRGCSMEEIIPRFLNMHTFDPETIIGNWQNYNNTEKWSVYLWYRLGLNKSSNYISYVITRTGTNEDLLQNLECAIIDCQDNSYFEEWIEQRDILLKKAGHLTPSSKFMNMLETITDTRVKLKLLSGRSHEERTKIIELVSLAMRSGGSISDYKTLLQEKFPDLLLYLKPSQYLSEAIQEYMSQYRTNKIADIYSMELSDLAGGIDCYQFESRGSVLHSHKNKAINPYFLWFDGLGIEWIDMLLSKISSIAPSVSILNVDICTAVLPTITAINMQKADPETISEKKIDDMDTISHIKDKSDCNYFSIIAKQFEFIDRAAQKIVDTIDSHPNSEVIVTADHGMSRMAAKGFHTTQGVNPPAKAEVSNLGRYCVLPSEQQVVTVTNTRKEGTILAFKTHNHFTSSGYAPGEIHGGATPEEWLVPVLHFGKPKHHAVTQKAIEYKIVSKEIYISSNNSATVYIQTKEPASHLVVDFNGLIIKGESSDNRMWTVRLTGVSAGNNYVIRVYPNNLYSAHQETIYVKPKGFVIDDDF